MCMHQSLPAFASLINVLFQNDVKSWEMSLRRSTSLMSGSNIKAWLWEKITDPIVWPLVYRYRAQGKLTPGQNTWALMREKGRECILASAKDCAES